ncbi:MAG: hypothetical protein HYS17_02370 [Micavibrio aeruginosavorus]|uniref:Uncharacterized protein n=1 Tax=Micavibrio aeruginosavorus TaxID=349221 RepID=A0A7T5UHP3_9BACT|nr:MAG: hypothetical protein HYS17_02370 [Micavibrio aeruginosavorus]
MTDPNDPRFDVTKFSFEDYKTEDELLKTLNALFPEGTTKQKVDDVLLKSARLDMFQNVGPDGGIYIVYKKSKHDPSSNHPLKTARFLYNESHEVMDIETSFMDGISIKYFIGERIQ